MAVGHAEEPSRQWSSAGTPALSTLSCSLAFHRGCAEVAVFFSMVPLHSCHVALQARHLRHSAGPSLMCTQTPCLGQSLHRQITMVCSEGSIMQCQDPCSMRVTHSSYALA